MEKNFAFFCDAATVDAGGKLNVLGIFQNIYAAHFPIKLHSMTFVVSMKGHRSEVGQHKIALNYVDSDGLPVIPRFQGIFNVGAQQKNVYFVTYLQNIIFPAPGDYEVDIVVDSHHLGSALLHVMLRK